MSQTSINQAANDPDLQKRVQSACYDEAFNNEAVRDSQFATSIRSGYGNFTAMFFAVAVDTETAYASGVLTGRGAPGHDLDVITDDMITASVKKNWPVDPTPITPPGAP